MSETTRMSVPLTVAASEAIAEADFWRERCLMQATLRDKAERELASAQQQIAEMQATLTKSVETKKGGK